MYQLFAIYCNKIRKVMFYCYKIFEVVNCLLQQHIYIYHCIKISCGTLDMMRWSSNSSAPNQSVIAYTQPMLCSKTISRMDNTKHWAMILASFYQFLLCLCPISLYLQIMFPFIFFNVIVCVYLNKWNQSSSKGWCAFY